MQKIKNNNFKQVSIDLKLKYSHKEMIRTSSICLSYIYRYLTDETLNNKDTDSDVEKKCTQLRCLSKTLEKYGGVLSKISQILSINDSENTVFTDCKPYSKKETLKFFKEFYNEEITKNNSPFKKVDVDFGIYKSGSIGQVHKAKYKGNDIILKIQYDGLKKQTKTDIDMLEKLVGWLYNHIDLEDALREIRKKMKDELNYPLEAKNQIRIRKLFVNNKHIEIPQIIPELCTDRILAMERSQGRSIKKFIKNNPTQQQRNNIGKLIVQFVFENIYKHGILYSDTHYGNFLVKRNEKLIVLDFGCIHYISDKLKNNLRNLHISLINKNKQKFYSITNDIGISTESISPESKEYLYEYFITQFEPWISKKFLFNQEWLDKVTAKNFELMKEWKLPEGLVYFNKIPYGTIHLLTKINSEINCYDTLAKILNYE
jgi:predicted unusual protein kinase regulating ubiquinone biosynthesis (AarF/ABC1/UbiB family)